MSNPFKFLAGLALSLNLTPAYAEELEIFTGEWPPYISQTLPGFGPHPERVRTILEKAGYQVQFRFVKFKRAYELVKTGKAVASLTWAKTDKRQWEVNFPESPLQETRSYGYYHKDQFPNGLKASSIQDFVEHGLRIVGVKGYWYEEELKVRKANVQFVTDTKAAWYLLNTKRADIHIAAQNSARVEIQTFLGKDALSHIRAVEKPALVTQQYLIFSKHHPQAEKALSAYNKNSSK